MPICPRFLAILLLGLSSCATTMTRHDAPRTALPSTTLSTYVQDRAGETSLIPPSRRATLKELASAITERAGDGEVALTFICTHNSRRSQMAQIWAKVAADREEIDGVLTYSGGTEATAFNPRAVAALKRAGFAVTSDGAAANPMYRVEGWNTTEPMMCCSKRFSDAANPSADFIAVMTCSDADEACPLVPGAATRIAVRYEDPKAFDGTAREAAAYDERCAQIAREMMYVFQQVDG